MTIANSELFGPSHLADSLSEKRRNLQSDAEFVRADWLAYISDLPRRALVPKHQIAQLVLKELVDNALDEMDRVGIPGKVALEQQANTFSRSLIAAAALMIHPENWLIASRLPNR